MLRLPPFVLRELASRLGEIETVTNQTNLELKAAYLAAGITDPRRWEHGETERSPEDSLLVFSIFLSPQGNPIAVSGGRQTVRLQRGGPALRRVPPPTDGSTCHGGRQRACLYRGLAGGLAPRTRSENRRRQRCAGAAFETISPQSSH
jgi:hypothetical protein